MERHSQPVSTRIFVSIRVCRTLPRIAAESVESDLIRISSIEQNMIVGFGNHFCVISPR